MCSGPWSAPMKSGSISIYLTAHDQKNIRANAKRCGLKLSYYLRICIAAGQETVVATFTDPKLKRS